MRSLLRWVGGKQRLLHKLLPLVPPHRFYMEGFGGAAALLFAKTPVEFEVYNDIDKNLYTLFKVLQDKEKFEEFRRLVYLTPYSRAFWKHCKELLETEADDVRRAWAFFITVRQGFGGKTTDWGFSVKTITRGMPKIVSGYLTTLENLDEIYQRVMRIQVENLDWRKLLEYYSGYDFDEEFIYLDPPYVLETRKCKFYEHEMTNEQHEELVDYLLTHKRRVLLSGYDNAIYAKLERHGWRKMVFKTTCSVVGRTRASVFQGVGACERNGAIRYECVWFNYTPPQSNLF
jgi:DNA adenine methylase